MGAPNSGQYHLLRPDQIDAIKRNSPIAYVPWGALEWHSYHNPVGLDGLIAEHLCLALAANVGGLVLPPVYVGTDTIKSLKGFAHSVEHEASTVQTLCVELCRQLGDESFRLIVVVTGHCGAGHREALERAVTQCNEELRNEESAETHVMLVPAFDPIADVWPVNHAADGETSLQMAADPRLVDLSKLPADRVATLDEDGVWGNDPSASTPNKGREIVRLFVERCGPDVRTRLENILTQNG